MDDGCLAGESFILNTHHLHDSEQVCFQNILEKKFAVKAKPIKDRHQTKLRIGKVYFKQFEDLIAPYIIPSMSYKIVSPRNDWIQNTAI